MKKFLIILFIICNPVSAIATVQSSFTITGITGKVLANAEKRLNELQQLKPLKNYSQDDLRYQLIKSIQPYGYFSARITTRLKNQSLWVFVNPGPQMHIDSLKVKIEGEGFNNPELLKALNNLPIKQGDPLLTEQYNLAKQNIINAAENQGYLHGAFKKAEILIDEKQYRASVTLLFDTGPLYYFGQVQFDPTYIKPELLHRFIPFKYGQPYSTEKIVQLNDYLSGSGYFNSVLVKPEILENPKVPVFVHLQPVSKYSYSLGLGYGTDTGIRGRAGLHIVPLNRSGHKFNALAQGSFTQSALQAQYIVPGKNPVNDQYSLTGNFSNLNYNTGYSNAFLVSLAQQHHQNHFQRNFSINTLYESFHYTLQPTTNQFLFYPKSSFTLSNTKNQLFSPSGFKLTFNALGASKAILSEIDVGQVSLDAKAALMLEPFRLRFYAHTIQGITVVDNINQLPLSLALLLGGTDNLKALSFNSVGPGRYITYGGFEIQKEFIKNWYMIGFYDAGSVYKPQPKEVLYDVGGSVMWVSPIGPIKIGLAQAVNSRFQSTGNSPRVVISMGPDL